MSISVEYVEQVFSSESNVIEIRSCFIMKIAKYCNDNSQFLRHATAILHQMKCMLANQVAFLNTLKWMPCHNQLSRIFAFAVNFRKHDSLVNLLLFERHTSKKVDLKPKQKVYVYVKNSFGNTQHYVVGVSGPNLIWRFFAKLLLGCTCKQAS